MPIFSRKFLKTLRGEDVSGANEQERDFETLWRDFWLLQACPNALSTNGRSRRWKDAMALFAQLLAMYKLQLARAQLEIWG